MILPLPQKDKVRINMRNVLLLCGVLLLVACNDQVSSTSTVKKKVETDQQKVERSFDFAQLRRGQQLFQKNCAACHGMEAEGTTNWQQRDADGKFPAPPLNGTAHAWHHSLDNLRETIRKGTFRLGGKMPPWEGRLSDTEIDDIIVWFQSKWSDEIYMAWYRSYQEPTIQK